MAKCDILWYSICKEFNMRRFILDENDKNLITGKEHNHLKNVLRLKVGDEIIGTRYDEYDYICKITSIERNQTWVDILDKVKNENNPIKHVTVFQAYTKSDNMNLIIQKLTELGISDIIPFTSQFVTAKDKMGKRDKMQEISNQSIKQCGRSIPVYVHDGISFDKMCEMVSDYEIVVFANEKEVRLLKDVFADKFACDNVAIVVGSEGGFSDDEIHKLITAGAKSVSLGKRILRSETASIALSALTLFEVGEL